MAHRKLCHGIVMCEGHDGRCACTVVWVRDGADCSGKECTLLCCLGCSGSFQSPSTFFISTTSSS